MLKSFFKDAAVYGIADFITKFIAFAVFPLFTYALTVEQFGIYALVTTLGALVGIVFNCGLNNAVQRKYMDAQTEESYRPVIVTTGFCCMLIFALFVCALCLAIIYPLSQKIQDSNQISWEMIVTGFLGTILMQCNIYCTDVIRLYFQSWKFTLLNLFQNLLMVGLSLLFVIGFQWGIVGYLQGVALAYALTLPFCLYAIRAHLTLKFNFKLAKELIHFGYPFIFSGLAFWIYGSMDRWMLAELSTNTEVGLYSLAFKLASVLIFVNNAFAAAWSPFALKSLQSTPTYKTYFSKLFILWFYFLLVIATALSLFSPELLYFVSPPAYWTSVLILPYIALGLALTGAGQVMAMGISFENRTIHFTYASWLTAVINLVMNYFLIPLWGAQGAAIATLFSNLILFGYYYLVSQKLHPLPINLKKMAICFILLFVSLYGNFVMLRMPLSYSLTFCKVGFLVGMVGFGFLSKLISVDIFKREQKPQAVVLN